ncbi:MAG: NACHT domain-containing protein [Chitinophagaceae bacterium]|nr:NACHT domain-containing protein [Chitinophagaceae bacterium]
MLSLFYSFLEKLIISLIVKAGLDNAKYLKNLKLKFLDELKYLKSIEEDIKNMPFIYKGDIDSTIIGDYEEDIQASQLTSNNLVLLKQHKPKSNSLSKLETFKSYHKILIVGDAGIGKTTFLRYIVLSRIQNKKIDYIPNLNKLLPVFVSLKAIKNGDKSPILNYLLSKTSLFEGPKGIDRLAKYIQTGRLLLILDGYDEIGFSEQQANFAKIELGALVSSTIKQSSPNLELLNTRFLSLYRDFAKCKVWISTRELFYNNNPLQSFDSIDDPVFYGNAHRYFAAVYLSGLGQKRLPFVEAIFNRYKSNSPLCREFLDAESFIISIDRTKDEELIKLSKWPLYLTIMCYLHVIKVKEAQTIITDWDNKIKTLINNCIDALLEDKDEYKVRSLSTAERKAFMDRRSSYTNEKKKFLGYLSYKLIEEEKNLFDENYLIEKALEYFNTKSISSNNELIISELENPSHNNPNLVTQILQADIFTAGSIGSAKKDYDFPHRRFRDILAINYIEDENGIETLINSPLNSKLLLLLSSLYDSDLQNQPKIIRSLLKHINGDSSTKSNTVISSLIKNVSSEVNEVFIEKIKENFALNLPINLHINILEKLDYPPDFIVMLQKEIRSHKTKRSGLYGLEFSYEFFFRIKHQLFELLLSREEGNPSQHPLRELLYAKYFWENYAHEIHSMDPEILTKGLKAKLRLLPSPNYLEILVLLHLLYSNKYNNVFVKKYLGDLVKEILQSSKNIKEKIYILALYHKMLGEDDAIYIRSSQTSLLFKIMAEIRNNKNYTTTKSFQELKMACEIFKNIKQKDFESIPPSYVIIKIIYYQIRNLKQNEMEDLQSIINSIYNDDFKFLSDQIQTN